MLAIQLEDPVRTFKPDKPIEIGSNSNSANYRAAFLVGLEVLKTDEQYSCYMLLHNPPVVG